MLHICVVEDLPSIQCYEDGWLTKYRKAAKEAKDMSELQAYYYTKARVWQNVGLEFEGPTEKKNALLKVIFLEN